MPLWKLQLTWRARQDLRRILRRSQREFGLLKETRAALQEALETIVRDPFGPHTLPFTMKLEDGAAGEYFAFYMQNRKIIKRSLVFPRRASPHFIVFAADAAMIQILYIAPDMRTWRRIAASHELEMGEVIDGSNTDQWRISRPF